MLLLLFYHISIVYSQCWVNTTNGLLTTITYEQSVSSTSSECYDYVDNNNTYIYLTSDIKSTEVVFDHRQRTINRYEYIFFYSDSIPPNLNIIRVLPQAIYGFYVDNNYFNSDIHLYYGCFNESGCVQTSDVIYLSTYSNGYTYFCDETSSYLVFLIFYKDNTDNSIGYPYIYVGGLRSQKLIPRIRFSSNNDYLKSISTILYICTSKNTTNHFDYIQIYYPTISEEYNSRSVCSRKDTNRYVMFHQDHTTYTNCSCWTKNSVTEMNQSTFFNYPDCIHNSTMFDLILPSLSSTYSLSDDLLEWYSIVFATSSQSIQINNGKILIIDELDLNQEFISFNEEVYVKHLTVTIPGASFNTLNFDNITTSSLNDDTMLFTTESTKTDFESFGFMQCGNIVAKSTTLTCECNYNGTSNEYYNNYNEIDLICDSLKDKEFNYKSLIINSSKYSTTSNEYWNELEIINEELILNGISTLTSNICEFENKTITINCNFIVKIMNINPNTKLIVNGELSIDTLDLNKNGIIESHGSISITSIEITTSQSNCFELISSNESLSQPSINSDYSKLLLSQNHLLRICPSSNTNYEVQCKTIGNTFDYTSFDLLHCPCIDENCLINVNVTQLDTRNIEFAGIFNFLTNITIAISYKTSLFSIEYEDDKYIFLIGNGAVGFETSLNTNSLKSETTTLSIHSSNQLYCKALLIQYNNQQCIIEDNTTYPNVGDIDNCQLQNGFGCEICYEGYESNVTYCNECSSNCLRCYNGECINCEMNYQLNETNQCVIVKDTIEIFDNNKTMKCNDGYYSKTNQCIQCLDDNCITCNSLQCLTCNNNYTLNNGNCSSLESNNGEEVISNYGVIDCNNGYYSNNSQCIDCSLTFGSNCELCNINGCYSCNSLNEFIINNGSCSANLQCSIIENSICLNCNDKGSWFDGNECEKCGDNCKNCINGYCIECNDGYILQSENNCVDTNEYPDNCITLSYYGTCQRCSKGYYINNNLCYDCSNECSTCHNLTYCFECNDGYMLNDNNECVDMSEFNANCKTAIPGSSGGCAICNNGYYRDQTTCKSCISNCTKCNNGESCLICESNYFLLNDASKCISYDDLTNCETPTQSGCTKCNDNYYLNNQYCTSCSNTTENCNTCNNNGECLTCQNDYILINYECIDYQLIDNCKESSDSKCTSCSFWHTLNEDQTGCDTQVGWWVIVLIILILLIILIGVCVLILYLIKLYLDHEKLEKQRKETTIFDMKTSNVQFKSTNSKNVVINTNELLFNDECEEIEVNEETRDLICVGNTLKHTIKVQFSVKDGCDKYEIRTNPQLITIPKGKAIEFEIFIKPLCTCKINDQIMLISVDLTKGKTITTPITINTITIMTTRLDYSELIEDVKLGEGSFGIVYKGTFRANQVAIKKIKQLNNNEQMEEFNKEVSMLDKFRNDYIVHFYGAVFIPTKICMVTEFAQYGSLQDLINKTKENPIDNTMKIKILSDCAKGISYLHSNGILHRDIKPDNFLILSLDTNVEVNSKLTDFGASRNINMLMTNMTFTKGIGTPKYMAPEILDKKKYKKSADIYSFAITIYETMIWNEVYRKEQFKFPWSIAEFVTNGSRLSKPDIMNESIYSLIDNCWKHEPKERYTIEEVIKEFEEMN